MIEEELPLSYGNSANGCGDSSVSLFPSQKQPKPSRSPRMKRSRTPTPPPVTQMSLSEIDSLISPLIRHRAGEFVESEIKLMIEEIGKRRHILLSTSSEYNNGLKKKAWEEVALNVALRYPKGPKRSGIQVSAARLLADFRQCSSLTTYPSPFLIGDEKVELLSFKDKEDD